MSEQNITMELNKIDGFEPKQYLRLIETEGQPPKYYLDVAVRKFWFRLKYPMGKITTKLMKLTDQIAVVEARIYLDRNDPEENYISNAIAQKYFSNDLFGTKYIELAETAAIGRCLANAGFGVQFALKDRDPEVVDAPIEPFYSSTDTENSIENGNKQISPTPLKEQSTETMNETVTQLPPAMQKQNQTKPFEQQAVKHPISVTNSMVEQPTSSPIEKQELAKDMPVDTIYSKLTLDTAAAVIVSCGFFKGKTLGQVSIEKPSSLEWYVKSYNGPDNLLRAASKFLLDTAIHK